MKKGLTAILVAALLIAACITEFAYVNRTFDGLNAEITVLSAEIDKDAESVARPETLLAVNKINDYWNKRKAAVQVMLNHLLLIEYEAKIVRLKSDIELNDRNLARIDLEQLRAMTTELKNLYAPFIRNVF